MSTQSTRTVRSVAPLTLALMAILSMMSPSFVSAHAIDARPRAPIMVGTMPDRNSAASFLARRVLTTNLRVDRRGDTAPSREYYEVTNITAEAFGVTGYAAAVNNDGRIVRTTLRAARSRLCMQIQSIDCNGTQ